MNYKLAFLTGKYKGKRLVIGEGTVVIGRYADCQIDLDDDDEVSRRHAVLETRSDGIYIRDLGALNSIAVNGQRVNEARLSNGDTIELGRTQFQFHIEHPPAVTTKRHRDIVQVMAFLAVVVLLVAEVGYLVFLGSWGKSTLVDPPIVKREVAQGKEEVPAKREGVVEAPAVKKVQEQEESPVVKEVTTKVVETKEDVSPEIAQPVVENKEEPLPPAKPIEEQAVDPGVDEKEVEGLKEEVATLKEAVEELKAEQKAAPVTYEDPVVAKAKAMMRATLRMIAAQDLRGADQELERIQIMAPDFLPAYVERARLYERRGELKLAANAWGEVLKRTVGTPLYEPSAAERMRIATLIQQKEKRPGLSRPVKKAGNPEKIEIVSVDRERFKTTGDFDEMRLLRVTLKPNTQEKTLDAYDVRIEVVFFDRDLETGTISPTRAVVPDEPLGVEGPWSKRDTKTVTAAYIVPRGFRMDEEDEYGERRSYYGYAIQVYYLNELQDEEARPDELLEKVKALKAFESQSLVPAEL